MRSGGPPPDLISSDYVSFCPVAGGRLQTHQRVPDVCFMVHTIPSESFALRTAPCQANPASAARYWRSLVFFGSSASSASKKAFASASASRSPPRACVVPRSIRAQVAFSSYCHTGRSSSFFESVRPAFWYPANGSFFARQNVFALGFGMMPQSKHDSRDLRPRPQRQRSATWKGRTRPSCRAVSYRVAPGPVAYRYQLFDDWPYVARQGWIDPFRQEAADRVYDYQAEVIAE